MVASFININATKFSLNGIEYHKTFLAFKINEEYIRVVNVYDSRFQLLGTTRYDQIEVGGIVYADATTLINNLADVLFSKAALSQAESDQIEQNRLDIVSLQTNSSSAGHTHDDRYYTETEINALELKLKNLDYTSHIIDGNLVKFYDGNTPANLIDTIDLSFFANQGTTLSLNASNDLVLSNSSGGILSALTNPYVLLSEKGTANGVAVLDSNGKIVSTQYGDLAVTDTIQATETTLSAFVANNAAYTFQQGDIIILAPDVDGNIAHYLFKGGDKSLTSSYSQLNATKIPISSVIGLQSALDGKEPAFTKNTAFNKNFGTTAGTVMEGNAVTKRTAKVITNTTQYTPIAEDYVSKRLIFTADLGETINININDSVAPDISGALEIVSAGNHLLNFVAGTGITLTPTANCILKTIGIGSLVSVTPEDVVTSMIVAGSLEYTSELSSSRPIKTISAGTYTLAAEDKGAWLRFTVACTVTVPDVVFAAKDEILGDVSGTGDVTFVAGTGVTINKVASRQAVIPPQGVIGLKFRTAAISILFGSLKSI